ncbi:PREDICTED: uncharacterized protein LOC106806988 [Priapulus caudatus]|uniref:Uncharacterized protein LOC106806988 n=1 Tax=Priapulus caudatus TaxID=37621 RepID=A0ABM1DXJ9_PRICU|nr:PREDICTED: uncharacterized protein LOC106806988 [Priapulus caudatus]
MENHCHCHSEITNVAKNTLEELSDTSLVKNTEPDDKTTDTARISRCLEKHDIEKDMSTIPVSEQAHHGGQTHDVPASANTDSARPDDDGNRTLAHDLGNSASKLDTEQQCHHSCEGSAEQAETAQTSVSNTEAESTQVDSESKLEASSDYKHGAMFDSLHGFDEITDEDNDTDSQDSVFITHNPAFISSVTSWTSEFQDDVMAQSQQQMTDSTASLGSAAGPTTTLIEPQTGAKPKIVSGSPKHGASKRGAVSPKLRRAAKRPETLSLPRPVVMLDKKAGKGEGKRDDQSPLDGMIEKEGDLISFIANDLEEKIKMSSPLLKQEEISFAQPPSSSSSTRSEMNAGIPIIDPQAVVDLELQAHRVADSLHFMMENLSAKLHSMSALTVACMQTYRDSVSSTCDNFDATIKAMYTLMARCEELGKTMGPVYDLRNQIKEIRRLLDLFESKVAEDPLLK